VGDLWREERFLSAVYIFGISRCFFATVVMYEVLKSDRKRSRLMNCIIQPFTLTFVNSEKVPVTASMRTKKAALIFIVPHQVGNTQIRKIECHFFCPREPAFATCVLFAV
jgi:hypothetical protein